MLPCQSSARGPATGAGAAWAAQPATIPSITSTTNNEIMIRRAEKLSAATRSRPLLPRRRRRSGFPTSRTGISVMSFSIEPTSCACGFDCHQSTCNTHRPPMTNVMNSSAAATSSRSSLNSVQSRHMHDAPTRTVVIAMTDSRDSASRPSRAGAASDVVGGCPPLLLEPFEPV